MKQFQLLHIPSLTFYSAEFLQGEIRKYGVSLRMVFWKEPDMTVSKPEPEVCYIHTTYPHEYTLSDFLLHEDFKTYPKFDSSLQELVDEMLKGYIRWEKDDQLTKDFMDLMCMFHYINVAANCTENLLKHLKEEIQSTFVFKMKNKEERLQTAYNVQELFTDIIHSLHMSLFIDDEMKEFATLYNKIKNEPIY